MLSIERREKIKEILLARKSVTVAEMAQLFSVSTETIRRDFEVLSSEGFLIKTYGGASLLFKKNITAPQKLKTGIMKDEKQRMAREAARLIQPGDCVFLDHSTTVLAMCDFLGDIPLTVTTNSLPAIQQLSQYANIQICSPGGDFDQKNQAFFGIETIQYLKRHCFDMAFISCTSLDLEYGIHDSSDMIAEFHRSVISCADRACLIADHTKFARSAFARTNPLADIQALITDMRVPKEWKEALKESGIELVEALK